MWRGLLPFGLTVGDIGETGWYDEADVVVADSALVEVSGDLLSDMAGGGRTKPFCGSLDGRLCWPTISVDGAGVGGRSS